MAISMMRADIRRVMKRIPRLIILAVMFLITCVIFITGVTDKDANTLDIIIIYEELIVGMAAPILFGLIEMTFVLSDDFKAGTMKSAIGTGISKGRIVLFKFLNIIILVFIDIFVLLGLPVFVCAALGLLKTNGSVYAAFILTLFASFIKTVMSLSLSMILVYFMQDTLMGALLHVAVSSTLIGRLIQIALQLKSVAYLHLDRFVPFMAFRKFYTRLILGGFDITSAAVVLVVILLGLIVSVKIFKGSELEF